MTTTTSTPTKYPDYPTNEYTNLQRIISELKSILKRESSRPEGYEHLTYDAREMVEEVISLMENETDYDPTPQYLYDNTGGESQMSAAEVHHIAWVQHQAMHG